MLLPTLVRDGNAAGPARLLPPRVENDYLRGEFDSSPPIVSQIESFFSKKDAKNDHEGLFGAAGGSGPSMYRESIKLHSWLCVAQIVFYGGQIVVRDAWAIFFDSSTIGNPPYAVPEAAVFALLVAVSAAQLWLVPTTFLNYCFATSIETMTKDWAVRKAKRESRALEEEMMEPTTIQRERATKREADQGVFF